MLYRLTWPLMKGFMRVLFAFLGGFKTRGTKNVPRKGGVLICPNHLSDADPPAVAVALPRSAYFMAKEEIFSIPILGALVRHFRGFPIKRDSADRTALRHAEELLKAGEAVVIFPENERARAYLLYQHTEPHRLSGADAIPRFIEKSVSIAPPEYYENAKPSGPLASFSGADNWVEHPYRDGIVLIGDAAGASDPSYGQGLDIALLDARVLRDQLLSNDDWNLAADAYAREHAIYYRTIHTVENWLSDLLLTIGPEADARRNRAFSLIAEDPTRFPDHIISGPKLPADEQVRQRLFGEI